MKRKELDARVLARSIIIASTLILVIFIGIFFANDLLAKNFSKQADNIQTGLMLFTIWLVVSSTLRSINKLRRNISAGKLIFAGTSLVAIGTIIYSGFLVLYPKLTKSGAGVEVATASMYLIAFFTAIAFVISLITTINLKVKSVFWGNVLEAIIIIGGIALFLLLA